MEKIIGIIIGGVIAIVTLGILFFVAGGAIIGAVTAVLTIPIIAPITTTLVIIMVAIGYLAYRKKTSRNKDDP